MLILAPVRNPTATGLEITDDQRVSSMDSQDARRREPECEGRRVRTCEERGSSDEIRRRMAGTQPNRVRCLHILGVGLCSISRYICNLFGVMVFASGAVLLVGLIRREGLVRIAMSAF